MEKTGISSGLGGGLLEAKYDTIFTPRWYTDVMCSKTKKTGKMYTEGIRDVIDRIEWNGSSKGYSRLEEI